MTICLNRYACFFLFLMVSFGCTPSSSDSSNDDSDAPATYYEDDEGGEGMSLGDVGGYDDGEGMSEEKTVESEAHHFGLEIMRERAESIQAELTIESEPGEGTRVAIELNL